MRQTGAICLVFSCTLVFLWLVLIGSKDLNGGEASDAVLTAQRLVLVSIHSTDLDDTLKVLRDQMKVQP